MTISLYKIYEIHQNVKPIIKSRIIIDNFLCDSSVVDWATSGNKKIHDKKRIVEINRLAIDINLFLRLVNTIWSL